MEIITLEKIDQLKATRRTREGKAKSLIASLDALKAEPKLKGHGVTVSTKELCNFDFVHPADVKKAIEATGLNIFPVEKTKYYQYTKLAVSGF